MNELSQNDLSKSEQPVAALGEIPAFGPGDQVRILTRSPIGHYRVPSYLRGQRATVLSVVRPRAIDNEEEGYGKNAGWKGYYYRIAVPMASIWSSYNGSSSDRLQIDIFETWLAGE
ncbi:nitrile hydratase subunit beta (plasmid) [Microvirga terrae]|uniref:Nitrile hydratase subunit beta n=1 Tax=Microvirga terrae TaxID=2740529 RepID=A0ABY5RZV4_9HYPH|nr:SH3-like domain-containing protein [Microvirga terrae]UVF22538.1 nitrile hydratase subunit beta [Microvirga terrae]